jgi:cytochrome c oxidase subunit II
MDPQLLINIAQVLLVSIFLLVCVNLYMVFRLKDIDPFAKWNANIINANLFMLFLIVGMIAAFVSTQKWSGQFVFMVNPASEHGAEIDRIMLNTMIVSLIASGITNILLFYYAWRYRHREGRKALYYPHNNKLEMVWTVVPAVVLTLLIFDGVGVWNETMGDLDEEEMAEATVYEVNGKQFGWTVRYPGQDGTLGESHVSYIDEAAGNDIGINFTDVTSQDDPIVQEIHLPVNKEAVMKIKSRDVLHSATIAHMRVKMDAVPGMPTSFHFKPTVTTAEMRERTGNPDFNYEMSCQQICGGGHWNMRRVVVVETEEEYQAWLDEQKPFYEVWKTLASEDEVEAAEEAARIAAEKAAKETSDEVAMAK